MIQEEEYRDVKCFWMGGPEHLWVHHNHPEFPVW